MNANVKITKAITPPVLPGKHQRLLCLTGEGKGTVYYLTGSRVVMGRGDTAEVKVMDIKSSREHAELVKVKDSYVLTDLGSQNGVVVNDLKVNQHKLSDGDKIIIGQTVFKYSEFVVGQEAESQEIENKKTSEKEEGEKEKKVQAGKKSKLPLLIVAVVVLFLVLSGDEEDASKKKNRDPSKAKDMTDAYVEMMMKKKDEEDKEVQRKLDTIIHNGQREFREGNYFRAIEEFNLALVLSPNNGRASFYLNKTKQSLDNHIEDLFLRARRQYDSLKYDAAGQTYCSIMKLLQKYPDDERYKQAQNQIGNVEKALGMYESEYKCFEE